MLIEDFNRIIDMWIAALEQYNFVQLCAKPSSASWSVGQMIRHLIDDAHFYIGQIKVCLSNNDHLNDEASPEARSMFLNNDFPDEAIEGSPNNAFIPQPDSKDQLMNALLSLKADMNRAAVSIAESRYHGKTKHPGFNYFSAPEWLQFAEMHFRHHLRQKKRIDDYLKTVDQAKE